MFYFKYLNNRKKKVSGNMVFIFLKHRIFFKTHKIYSSLIQEKILLLKIFPKKPLKNYFKQKQLFEDYLLS